MKNQISNSFLLWLLLTLVLSTSWAQPSCFSIYESSYVLTSAQRVLVSQLSEKNPQGLKPKHLKQIIRETVSEKQLFFKLAKLLSQLKFAEADELFLKSQMLEAIQSQGLLKTLKENGLLKDKTSYDRFRWKLYENKEMLSQFLQSAIAVGAVSYGIYSGEYSAAAMSVAFLPTTWSFVRAKELPDKLVNNIIEQGIDANIKEIKSFYGISSSVGMFNKYMSHAIQTAFVAVTLIMVTDQTLQQFGYNSKDILMEYTTDRSALELQVLETLQKDAAELGFTFDPSATEKLHEQPISALKAIIAQSAQE